MTHNRRQFSRVLFHAEARLYLPGEEFDVRVVDLSLRGALVTPMSNRFVPVGAASTLKIRLDEMGTTIRLEGTVVHRQGGHVGFYCTDIDLDSVTHLRRLIELNMGDAKLLERELALLSYEHA